jgi:hypothetical protein
MAILFFLLDIEPFPFLMRLGAPPVPVRLPDRGVIRFINPLASANCPAYPDLPHAWDDAFGHVGHQGRISPI